MQGTALDQWSAQVRLQTVELNASDATGYGLSAAILTFGFLRHAAPSGRLRAIETHEDDGGNKCR